MMRKPSRKAEKAVSRLFIEAKKFNEFCKEEQRKGRNDGWFEPDIWKFANTPMDGETLSMLKDMSALMKSRKSHIEMCGKLGIYSSYSLSEYEIVNAHVQDRISTYE